MISLKNIWVTKHIPQKELVQVARKAQEQDLLGTEEQSADMGICDQFCDSVFFGGMEQTAKIQLHGMSKHVAALHWELEKPLDKRTPEVIKIHLDAITECQDKLSEVMLGETIEYGRDSRRRPIVGKDSYLIHRTQSKIYPRGIPLYEPGEIPGVISTAPPKTIPTFKQARDIGVEHIQQIRANEKICCNGKTYRVYFMDRNRPLVISDLPDYNWWATQSQLVFLYSRYEKQFVLEQTEGADQTTEVLSTQLSDTRPVQRGTTEITIPETASPVSVVAPETIPTFETALQIKREDHWCRIRINEKICCEGRTYQIRYNKGSEPVVIGASSDPIWKTVALRMTVIWIQFQADRALDHLRKIVQMDGRLPEFSILPELEMGQSRSTQETILSEEWNALLNTVAEIIPRFQNVIVAKKNGLARQFEELLLEVRDASAQKAILLKAEAQLPALALSQEHANNNIAYVKKLYIKLFNLAKTCTNTDLRKIIKERILNFNEHIIKFTNTDMSEPAVTKQLLDLLKTQEHFIEQFNMAQIKRWSDLLAPPDIVLGRGISGKAISIQLREKITALLKESTNSWRKIQEGLPGLEKEQIQLAVELLPRLETQAALKRMFQAISFNGAFEDGLVENAKRSVYKSETYTRIVTLKKMQAELQINLTDLTDSKFKEMQAMIHAHVKHISTETDEINLNAQSIHFSGHKTYPVWTVDRGVHMDFSQWSEYQKAQ